jgi:hypothetical protein
VKVKPDSIKKAAVIPCEFVSAQALPKESHPFESLERSRNAGGGPVCTGRNKVLWIRNYTEGRRGAQDEAREKLLLVGERASRKVLTHQFDGCRIVPQKICDADSALLRKRHASALHRLIDRGAAQEIAPIVVKNSDDSAFLGC